MLDIIFIRENQKLVEDSAKSKQITVDIPRLLKLDDERRSLQQKSDELRAARNQLSQNLRGKPDESIVKKGKKIKAELEQLEAKLGAVESDYDELMMRVPNVMAGDTPLGGEEANKPERHWGETEKRSFTVQDHLSIGETNDWIDFERGVKVAGAKFYYLKGAVVELEMALMRWGVNELKAAGFTLLSPPHLTNGRIYEGSGFQPRGEESQAYWVQEEDLALIGTAEIPLGGYHADEILDSGALPLLYAALTPSYRREAGAYGKHSRGLYRVHQFDKLELFVFCEESESEQWHQKLLEIEESLYQQLEIPYRVVRTAAGDLGAPAYKKYDLEYWSPVDDSYREITSCSNCTDFQARRLNIRVRSGKGDTTFVHTLNGTALAYSRVLIALLENYQTADGKIEVPKVLQDHLGRGQLG